MKKQFDVQAARKAGMTGEQISQFMKQNNLTERKTMGGFLSNVGKSGGQLVSDLGTAILNPMDTVKGVASLGSSVISNILPGEQGNEQLAKDVGEFYKDRYGSLDKAWETLYNDPVGMFADASTVLGGAGLVAKGARLGKMGSALSKAGRATDPMRYPGYAVGAGRAGASRLGIKAPNVSGRLAGSMASESENILTRGMGNPKSLGKVRGVSPVPMSELFDKYNLYDRAPETFGDAARSVNRTGRQMLKDAPTQVDTRRIVKLFDDEIAKLSKEARTSSKARLALQELQSRKQMYLEGIQNTGTETFTRAKHKNVDDFLKSKGQPLYHGTTAQNITELKPGGVRGRAGEASIPGISITDDYGTASYYAKKNGIQINSPIETYLDGKVLEVDGLPQLKQKLGINDWTDTTRSGVPDLLRKQGYDGVKIKGYGDIGEIIVTNPSALKTKSQLTDIYNQATPQTRQSVSTPLGVDAARAYDIKSNFQGDMPPYSFGMPTSEIGKNLGTKRAYQTLLSGIEEQAPGIKNIGREQSALRRLEDIAKASELKGATRQNLNFSKLGSATAGGVVAGIPGAVAGYIGERMVNSPQFLGATSRGLGGGSRAMQSGAKVPQAVGNAYNKIPAPVRQGIQQTPGALYTGARVNRMLPPPPPPAVVPQSNRPMAEKKQDKKPRFTVEQFQQPKQKNVFNNNAAFGGNFSVKRGNFS